MSGREWAGTVVVGCVIVASALYFKANVAFRDFVFLAVLGLIVLIFDRGYVATSMRDGSKPSRSLTACCSGISSHVRQIN
jgi:hypothetical protein